MDDAIGGIVIACGILVGVVALLNVASWYALSDTGIHVTTKVIGKGIDNDESVCSFNVNGERITTFGSCTYSIGDNTTIYKDKAGAWGLLK